MNDFFSSLLRKLRLLPVLVVVASLTFMVRIGDTFFQIKNINGSAYAQEEKKEEKKAEPVVKAENAEPPKEELPTAKASAVPELKNPADAPATGEKVNGASVVKSADKKKWEDSDTDFDDSSVRQEVYQDLMQRRQMIEEKEKDLDQREALLKAGTEEVNKKVEELSAIRTEIQSLLKKQNAEDEANSAKLVKIYEGMKPKDAAKIFNQLDMDVLLSVVTKMSERKVSPIIALMDPDKARSLTLFLSEQNKLPGTGSTTAGFNNSSNPPALPESAVR